MLDLTPGQRRAVTMVGMYLTQPAIPEWPQDGIETALVFGVADFEFGQRLGRLMKAGKLQQALLCSLASSAEHPPLPTVELLQTGIIDQLPAIEEDRLELVTDVAEEEGIVLQGLEALQALTKDRLDGRPPWSIAEVTVITPPLQLRRLTYTAMRTRRGLPFNVTGGTSLIDQWPIDLSSRAEVTAIISELVRLLVAGRSNLHVPAVELESSGAYHTVAIECLRLAYRLEVMQDEAIELLRQFDAAL